MKHWMVVIFGVFIIILCSMPIMAEKPVGIDDDVLSPGTDSGTSILAKSALDEAPPHTTGFSEGFVASGGATQSPVLNGGEYTNYDTIFYHGSLAEPGGIVDPTLVEEPLAIKIAYS